MKKIDLSFCQSVDEINFILKKEKSIQNIFWIPLNLECYLFLKEKKLKYFDLFYYFKSQDHKNGLFESEKFLKKLKLSTNTIDTRTKGILRKFFNSIFFVITILGKIEKKYKINRIILSGWSSFNFLSRYRNYFISQIIYELYRKKNIIFIFYLN